MQIDREKLLEDLIDQYEKSDHESGIAYLTIIQAIESGTFNVKE